MPEPNCALVVGGSGGIGSSIVRTLSSSCEKVYFTYNNNRDAADALKAELSAVGANVVPIKVDIADDKAWAGCLDALTVEGPIDVLVNAAGVSVDGLSIDVEYEDLVKQYQINVFAAWRAMSTLGRDMVFHRRGRIINVASIAATFNSPGRSAYASTKAALISLTKSFAVELGRFDVRVNAIAPGFVDTDMIKDFDEGTRSQLIDQIPLGRFAQADEIAHAVDFLASAQASYLHGSVMVIDGGTTA